MNQAQIDSTDQRERSQPIVEDTLAELVERVRQTSSLPLERARMLPPAAYTSHEFAEFERRAIFENEWVCIGRIEQMPRAGDYVSYNVGGQPVVSVRQKSGSIETFSNVCLHRCTTLVDGVGHLTGLLTCPYHAWAYGHDGVLRATPYSEMQQSPECKAGELRLKTFSTEIWNNWVFISLSPTAKPLARQLEGLLNRMPGVNLERYENIVLRDEIWDVNWKLLTENFIESYHLFMVHPKTIEPWCSTRTARFLEGEDAYTLHLCPTVPGKTMEMVRVDNAIDPPTDGFDPNFGFDFCVFPTFMAAGDRSQIWWMALQPIGAKQVMVRYGFCVTPECLLNKPREEIVKAAAEWLDIANAEDKAIVGRVMRGIAGPFIHAGTLAGPQDRPVWEFARYIGRMINNTTLR